MLFFYEADLFLLGTHAILFIYYIIQFIIYRQKPHFYFALGCFIFAIRAIVSDINLDYKGYETQIPETIYNISMYINCFSFLLGPLFNIFLAESLFPEEKIKYARVTFTTVIVLLLLYIIITPVSIFAKAKFFDYFIILLVLYANFIHIRSVIRKRPYAKSLCFAQLIVFVGIFYDVLSGRGYFVSSFENVGGYTYYIFIIIYIIIFSIKTKEITNELASIRASVSFEKQKTDMLLSHNECIESKIDEIRMIKHDMNNDLHVINEFIKDKEYKKAKEYISNISKTDVLHEPIIISNNKIINILLNKTIDKATKESVDFNYKVRITELKITDNDLCSLISNILDNAVEAAKKADKRWIDFNIHTKNSFLYISCENIYLEKPIIKNNVRFISTKPSNANSGYGLIIIKKIVEKYNGLIELNYNNNIFKIEIILKQ